MCLNFPWAHWIDWKRAKNSNFFWELWNYFNSIPFLLLIVFCSILYSRYPLTWWWWSRFYSSLNHFSRLNSENRKGLKNFENSLKATCGERHGNPQNYKISLHIFLCYYSTSLELVSTVNNIHVYSRGRRAEVDGNNAIHCWNIVAWRMKQSHNSH